MKLARAVYLDDSDLNVFAQPARTGEWCISGGFAFSDWSERDLEGKARQAFSNGWLGLETWGRVTFVAITPVQPEEAQALELALARHFVEFWGAPSEDAALPVAREEIAHMAELCDEHDDNTLLTVSRDFTEAGIRESFRVIETREADIAQFAVHSVPEE